MMDSLTRMTSLALVFGFFFISACSSHLNTLEDARELYETERYDRALAALNRLLQDDPENDQLLFLKADVLKNLAVSQTQPANRESYYREMNATLKEIGNAGDSEWISRRDILIVEAWHHEQESAVSLIQHPDPESEMMQIDAAIAHANNALAANPDSISTYNLKATAYYLNNDLTGAVTALLDAEKKFSSLPLEMEEKLAFLLLEEGQLMSAIEHYRNMLERNPGNEDIMHGLVNAYILDEQHENSIELLKQLVDIDSDNYLYRQSLATELFFYIQNSVIDLNGADFDDREIMNHHENLMSDLDEAEGHYQFVKKTHPNPDEINFITAAFYTNTANHLMQLADSRNNRLSDRLHDKAHELLELSVPVWKSVAERNPENPEIWKSMYQIYSELEMNEEAEDALSNIN